MKIDAKAIAQAMARKKENLDLDKEARVSSDEQVEMGDHIKAMASFIESIHNKDAEKAHEHMKAYASFHVKPNEPQNRE